MKQLTKTDMPSNSDHMIESLLDPSVYPHRVERLRLIQTHISWVILTGSFAYKIKKPVDLGFADFSSLAKREHSCREELRLNRRLAPELYLNVISITGTPSQPRVDGEGEPIEFAVKMREFPQDSLLSHVIEHGELTPSHIGGLAIQLANFHNNIATAGADSEFGTPDSVWQPVIESIGYLLNDDDPEFRDRIEHLEQWSRREFQRLASALTGRKAKGLIRECHGDMHLGNMILTNNEVVVFDGIDFNESLRWIDVLSDVAFVLMDLEDHKRHDLANQFLNSYLEQTGDYLGLEVLPFYKSYRALVRAKVDRIRIEQRDLDGADREQLGSECLRYVKLAEQFTKRREARLLITHGVSGSGKTSGTQRLVEEAGAIRIRSDVERKRLLGLQPDESTDSAVGADAYSRQNNLRTYDRLARLAESILDAGFSVIVDATFLKRADRRRFHRLAEASNVPFGIVRFAAPDHELRRRIAARASSRGDASEATNEVLDRQLIEIEELDTTEVTFLLDSAGAPRAADC